jgi:hypothetical protein
MRFSAEWWAFWAGVFAVGLTVGAALAGLVAWWFSNEASAESTARTRALELRVSEQQERAAIAERSLLELQERSRPRTIDADARATIVEFLDFGTHLAPVSVEFVSGSVAEPHDFAIALTEAIRAANWTVANISGEQFPSSPPRGLVIRISDVGGVEEQATQLQDALARAGLDPRLVKDRDVKVGEIRLRVGLKP